MAISKKVAERLAAALKRMLPVVAQQKARDVSEADTVTLVKDLFAEAFGYDKYAELTSEFAIRGTYCDLAIRLGEKVVELVEVKAIGATLDDRHVRQAVDYAVNHGVEWVILTNAATWRLYQVVFAKPVEHRLLCAVDLLQVDPRRDADLETLYLFTKEGFARGAHIELRDRQDATSRFLLAALLTENEAVVATIRRELRRVVDVLVSEDDITGVLRNEVIKRDTLEGPEAASAAQRVNRGERSKIITRRAVEPPGDAADEDAPSTQPPPAP